MSTSEIVSQADRAFVEEDYETALSLYGKASESREEFRTIAGHPLKWHQTHVQALLGSPGNAKIHEARSHAYLKAEDFMAALADAAKAVELEPSMPKAYLRQGCVRAWGRKV